MNCATRICICYFSPCGNVKKIAECMGDELSKRLDAPLENFDFTPLKAREKNLDFTEEDIVVIGSPVFAGRVPNKIMPYIKESIKGNNSRCVCAVSYGNRAYDNALSELTGLMGDNGMKVIGACAVESEHSFASELATGCPDEEDLSKLRVFARDMAKKILDGDFSSPTVPGEYPCGKYYTPLKEDGTPAVFLKAVPKVTEEKCVSCGRCSFTCPMGSVSFEPPFDTKGICIKCQACIKACPAGARYFDNEDFISHKRMLTANYSQKKQPDFFV